MTPEVKRRELRVDVSITSCVEWKKEVIEFIFTTCNGSNGLPFQTMLYSQKPRITASLSFLSHRTSVSSSARHSKSTQRRRQAAINQNNHGGTGLSPASHWGKVMTTIYAFKTNSLLQKTFLKHSQVYILQNITHLKLKTSITPNFEWIFWMLFALLQARPCWQLLPWQPS